MRSAWLAVVAVLLCGCATAAAKQVKVEYRELKSGGYAASSSPAPQVVIANDAEAYRRIWGVLIGPGEPPQVDFSKETAVFLLDRQHMTGGFSLEPRAAKVENGTTTVTVMRHAPERGSMTAQVITTPFVVVAVRATGIAGARWVDEAGAAVAESAKKR